MKFENGESLHKMIRVELIDMDIHPVKRLNYHDGDYKL